VKFDPQVHVFPQSFPLLALLLLLKFMPFVQLLIVSPVCLSPVIVSFSFPAAMEVGNINARRPSPFSPAGNCFPLPTAGTPLPVESRLPSLLCGEP